jgi:Meckel syndrome type 1 protein
VVRDKSETLHAAFAIRTTASADMTQQILPVSAPEPQLATTFAMSTASDLRPVLSPSQGVDANAAPDLAALVDRIVEARAGAAPDTVRAALVHQEFGSVSLRLRTEDTHIHVTLGSADPGFAPAVHAAAATAMAGNANDGERREQSAPQSQHQAHQHATGAQNAPTSQQHQSARNSASTTERVSNRSDGSVRDASEQAQQSQSAPDRRNGVYA